MFRCFFDLLDSTNTEAKRVIKNSSALPDILSIIATNQTQSRGKLGAKWKSSVGNLHLSVVINLEKYLDDIKNIGLFSILASLSVRKTLNHFSQNSLFISKWPNDILVNSSKIAGILLELETNKQGKNYLIIGIGVNLAVAPIIDKYKTTSLSDIISKNISIFDFAEALEDNILHYINELHTNKEIILNKFKENLYCFGEYIQIKLGDIIKTGIFYDITPEGYLVLKDGDSQSIITAGEIFGF